MRLLKVLVESEKIENGLLRHNVTQLVEANKQLMESNHALLKRFSKLSNHIGVPPSPPPAIRQCFTTPASPPPPPDPTKPLPPPPSSTESTESAGEKRQRKDTLQTEAREQQQQPATKQPYRRSVVRLESNYNFVNAAGVQDGTNIDDIIISSYQGGCFKNDVQLTNIPREERFTDRAKLDHCLDLLDFCITYNKKTV